MEITKTISNELVEKAFNLIRNSEELGRGSCSSIDECFTDDELRKAIVGEIIENPTANAKDIFDSILEFENIRNSYERDIQGA